MEPKLEQDLQDVNRNIIALPEDEVKRNNQILGEIVRDQMLPIMKDKSALFEYLFRNIFYAGSFFCGLKVGHPDEYDLVFLLDLPKVLEPILNTCTVPGFVNVQLQGMKSWEKGLKNYPSLCSSPTVGKIDNREGVIKRFKNAGKIKESNGVTKMVIPSTVVPRRKPNPNQPKIRCRSQKMQTLWDNIRYNKSLNSILTKKHRIILSELVNLLDDNYYLDTGKVSAWMEKIIQTSFDTFNKKQDNTFIKTSFGNFRATLTKSGPAFTLKLRKSRKNQRIIIDIDLVPGFVFASEHWPPEPFRPNPTPEKAEFFIVPKKPDKNKKGNFSKCWRPSFQEQESILINDLQNFKPCIRLLKRIRDVGNHKTIASYHLKTIFLWALEEEDDELWSEPLSEVFMTMLIKCQRIFKRGVILNYWNPKENLIKGENRSTLNNIANNFRRIIEAIERSPDNIFKYVD